MQNVLEARDKTKCLHSLVASSLGIVCHFTWFQLWAKNVSKLLTKFICDRERLNEEWTVQSISFVLCDFVSGQNTMISGLHYRNRLSSAHRQLDLRPPQVKETLSLIIVSSSLHTNIQYPHKYSKRIEAKREKEKKTKLFPNWNEPSKYFLLWIKFCWTGLKVRIYSAFRPFQLFRFSLRYRFHFGNIITSTTHNFDLIIWPRIFLTAIFHFSSCILYDCPSNEIKLWTFSARFSLLLDAKINSRTRINVRAWFSTSFSFFFL